MEMKTQQFSLLPQCLFCAKTQEESELIEMNTNSIFIDEEVFEFEELLRNLFDSKVCKYSFESFLPLSRLSLLASARAR